MTTHEHPSSPTVLVPRGGTWGEEVAELLDAVGLAPRVVPLIETDLLDTPEVTRARDDAASGAFDWVVLTSAAAVAALPPDVAARIAAVGNATGQALREAGYALDLVPATASARGLLEVGAIGGRVLVLRSDLAAPTLTDGLRRVGAGVTDVVAYRTRECPVRAKDLADLAQGRFAAGLITSGSVARSLARFDIHPATRIVCLGPGTADEAQQAGLTVDAVAAERSVVALVGAAATVLLSGSVQPGSWESAPPRETP